MLCQFAQILTTGCGNGIPSRAVKCAVGMPNPCLMNCKPNLCLKYQPRAGIIGVSVSVPKKAEEGKQEAAKTAAAEKYQQQYQQQLRQQYSPYAPVRAKKAGCGTCGGGRTVTR